VGALLSGRKRGINVLFERGNDYHHIKIDKKYYPFVKLSNLFVCEVPG
jgi:hypothetical protein